MNVNGRTLRRLPLAAALMIAGLAQAEPLSVPMPAAWKPGDGRGVAALFPTLVGVMGATMPLRAAIGIFAAAAYGLLIIAALLLPETRGRELQA